jgi:hypothetical protein
MSIKTQGTKVYFVDEENQLVIAIGCATAISGVSATRDQRETTCLEDDARTYEPGMKTPGQASVSINFDPADPSHVRLYELYEAGTTFDLAVGMSDGVSEPTLDSSNDFVLPNDRSWLSFIGAYLADVPLEFALSASVTSSLSFQLSGDPLLTVKV